jgi:molybdopterin-guanine dinucleotide biosynthesis protein MobB
VNAHDVPVVSVVGKSGSGKTTLLEKVIAELTRRGYRVATIKHHTHSTDVDVPGKDTWRHARAGAREVVLKGQGVVAVFKAIETQPSLEDLLSVIDDADIVLTEGFHREGRTMIEVSRRACSTELVNDPGALFALVTDNVFETNGLPVFGLDDHLAVVQLIEATILAAR